MIFIILPSKEIHHSRKEVVLLPGDMPTPRTGVGIFVSKHFVAMFPEEAAMVALVLVPSFHDETPSEITRR